MHVIKASILMIMATCLLTFVGMAMLIAPPTLWTDRDILLLALAVVGFVLGGWSCRELFLLNSLVRRARSVF